MYKKSALLLFTVLIVSMPLSARAAFSNVGFSQQSQMEGLGFAPQSLTLNGLYIGGEGGLGIYGQISPYVGVNRLYPSGMMSGMTDENMAFVGINGLIGVGTDLNYGRWGLVLGGGYYADFGFYGKVDQETTVTHFLTGVGSGAHIYLMPDEHVLVNIGLTAAWTPYNYITGTGSQMNWDSFQVNISLGVGWRLTNSLPFL